MKTARCILALALLATGCQAIAPTSPAHLARRVVSPHVTSTTPAPSVAPTTAPLTDPTRLIDTGSAVQLIGKVKLISDKGLGLVDASTLISDKGLGIISNNGSGLISDKGGSIVSNNSGGYHVLADAPGESTLIHATIEVLDGDGKLLVGKDGKPITATSDATGNYTLAATLPDENLWLRVKLPSGDQLSALLVRDGSSDKQTIDIDTASTLGATYVLQNYVKGSKTVYARLPATDAQKLLQDTQDAESLLTSLPSYKPSDVVTATDALRAKSTTLDTELTHIKNLLLLGQTDLGSGLQATAVPLTGPDAVFQDAAGNVYIMENVGRVRKVAPNGQISLYARQVVETTVQQDLLGPIDFKVLTETGRTQYRIEEGLLAFEHAVLDEAFDARDLLLRSLFSVLHEREFAVGPRVIKAKLATAIFTTNRYLSELLAQRPETLLAFSDRVAFAAFTPKGFVEPGSRMAVLAHAAGHTPPMSRTLGQAQLDALRLAARQVQVDGAALMALASLADRYERTLREPSAGGSKQPPTRYLSGRALAKAVGIWKAAVLRDRITAHRTAPLRAAEDDLVLLRPFFALAGPAPGQIEAFARLSIDPRDQAQLKLVAAEQVAFGQALEAIRHDLKTSLEREAAELRLADLSRPDLAVDRVTLGARAARALDKAHHAAHRDMLKRVLRECAEGYVAEGPSPLAGDAHLARVGELDAMLGGLRAVGDAALLHEVVLAACAETRAEIMAAPLVEAAEEFEASRPTSLDDLVAQVRVRIESFDLAEARIAALSALAGQAPSPEQENLLARARALTARALRRRAGALVARPRGGADLATLSAEVEPLAEIDQALELLSKGAGRLRIDLVSARATGLLRRELASARVVHAADLVELLHEAEHRLSTLAIEPAPVLRTLRPVVGRRLQTWLSHRAQVGALPPGERSEEGYLALIGRCTAESDRAAVAALARLVSAEDDPLLGSLRDALAQLDAEELTAQVSYLETWFAQVAGSIPAPGELATLPQAESAWATVSDSRFYRQTWRDRELATLRARLHALSAVPRVADLGQAASQRLEKLMIQSEHFGRALLDRRAALASAA